MNNFIEFKNVTKGYKIGDKTYNALDNVSFSLPKGEFVCILGPSGAGKSTLLNLLGGMDTVTSGDIIIDKENISKKSDKELTSYRAENVGFIFQFYNILPTLTVLENVEIVKDIVKKPKSAKKILKDVGLENHLNKFPNQLSGGEQQRVSIARAIAKNPKLLLCDEPTGALDYITGKQILKLLQDTCRLEHMTVIIITHNSAICPMADKVIKFKNGAVSDVIINDKPMDIKDIEW